VAHNAAINLLDNTLASFEAAEIIGNSASFDHRSITDALIRYFSADGRVVEHERRTSDEVSSKYAPRITGRLESDFIRLANSRFLDFIIEYCCDKNSRAADLLVAYAAIELYERRLKLMHQTYEKALAAYKTEMFTFVVPGAKQAQLQFLNPVLQNRMKDFKAPTIETAE
jgi:hypothetical protein